MSTARQHENSAADVIPITAGGVQSRAQACWLRCGLTGAAGWVGNGWGRMGTDGDRWGRMETDGDGNESERMGTDGNGRGGTVTDGDGWERTGTDGNGWERLWTDGRGLTVYDNVGLQASKEEALDDRLPPLLLRHPAQLEGSPLVP